MFWRYRDGGSHGLALSFITGSSGCVNHTKTFEVGARVGPGWIVRRKVSSVVPKAGDDVRIGFESAKKAAAGGRRSRFPSPMRTDSEMSLRARGISSVDNANRRAILSTDLRSAMFTYSIKRGIDLGLLDRKEYAPVVAEGYRSTTSNARVKVDGLSTLWASAEGVACPD